MKPFNNNEIATSSLQQMISAPLGSLTQGFSQLSSTCSTPSTPPTPSTPLTPITPIDATTTVKKEFSAADPV